MWHSQSMDNSLVLADISFPEIIPDVDGDGVKDLAVLCRFAHQQHHVVALISGKHGLIMGQPFESKSCSDIHNLTLDENDYTLYYDCKSVNGCKYLYFYYIHAKIVCVCFKCVGKDIS